MRAFNLLRLLLNGVDMALEVFLPTEVLHEIFAVERLSKDWPVLTIPSGRVVMEGAWEEIVQACSMGDVCEIGTGAGERKE